MSCDEISSASDAPSDRHQVAGSGVGSAVSHRRRPLQVRRECQSGDAKIAVAALTASDGGDALSLPDELSPRRSHADGDVRPSGGAPSRMTSKGVGGEGGGDGESGKSVGHQHPPQPLHHLHVGVKRMMSDGVCGDDGDEGDGDDALVFLICSVVCCPCAPHCCRSPSD